MASHHYQIERQLMDRLRSVFQGRRWIIAGEVAQGIVSGAEPLRSLGATDVLAIATRTGVGPLPDDVRILLSDDSKFDDTASMIERIHDSNRQLHDLPRWVIDEVDAWDPERSAHVVVGFTVDGGLVAERPTFGARRPAWADLEDKIAIRALWCQAGVTTAPDQVVALDDLNAVLAAHDALATGLGTVWATDNDQGWHGGGSGTHWVTNRKRAGEVTAALAERHGSVRVQPFLEGVPCSIHGMVLRDATLAFRPCEMIVLLDPDAETFEYARTATFWDPDPADRERMRETARAIGDALRDRVDYRGVFTVDGVLTADGFRPTEVNPRFGAALPERVANLDGRDLSLWFVHLAAVEGHLDDLDPRNGLDAFEIEALVLDRLDANRAGGAFIPVATPPAEGLSTTVAITGTVASDRVVDLRVADDDDPVVMTAEWGVQPGGGMILVRFTDAMPVGPPVAPTVLEARAFLAQHWGLELAELRTAFGR